MTTAHSGSGQHAATPQQILAAEKCSLVVVNRGVTRTFTGRGVSDLYRLLTCEPQLLAGADVADKVVGKGAAALMILGKVRHLHADVISDGALELFAASEMKVEFNSRVPHIINRAGTGLCPVETLCRHCRTASDCLPLIKGFLESPSC